MRLSYVGRTLASGALFYVIASACSSDRVGDANGDGGIGSTIDALVDGVIDPVKEASAEEVDVVTEKCDKQGTSGAVSSLYAVHAYPGKSVQDLARLRVAGHWDVGFPSKATVGGTAFEYQATLAVLSPGVAAVNCGSPGGLLYDTVIFALPK